MASLGAQRAVSVTGRGRAAATAAFFAQGCAFAVVLTHLDAFEDRWQIDDLVVTVIMFLVALLAAGGSAIAALLTSRFGSARALKMGLVGLAVGLVVAGTAPAFAVFCVGIACYGVALGCVDATTNMQAVACESLEGRSILTSFHAAWSAGGIVGALETSGTGSWGWPVAASVAPVAIVPLLVAFGRFLPPASDVDGEAPELPAVRIIPWKAMAVLGTAIVLFYIADSAVSSWSTIYLSDVLAAGHGVAPLGYAAYQATSLVSRLAGDHVVRRVGPALVVRCAAGVGAVGLLMVVLARVPLIAIIGFAILGIGIAVVAPLTFAASGRLAERDAHGNAITDPHARRAAADAIIARVNQFNYLGFVLGGVLTGLVASGSTMREGFIVPLVGIILILPLARTFRPAPGRV